MSRVLSGEDPLLYVIAFILASILLALITAPFLFPRAKRARRKAMLDLAERFPFLLPLVDKDGLHDQNLDELRGMARDLDKWRHEGVDDQPEPEPAFVPEKEGAVVVEEQDLAKQADPNEPTASRDSLPARLEARAEADARPAQSQPPGQPQPAAQRPNAKQRRDPQVQQQSPRSKGLPQMPTATAGEDSVTNVVADKQRSPGGEGSPEPKLRRLQDVTAAYIPKGERSANGAESPDDSTTIVRQQKLPNPTSDELRTGNATDPDAETVLRDALVVGDGAADDEETVLRDALDRDAVEELRETIVAGQRDASDPDATTENYEGWKNE